ncbi:MAG: hypothetical protein A3J07_04520 [Candidatus Doudnabacteria bacterium RIFCSPLOWO2_02_FULL_49_13]|uniref:Uncharacterized protein n=1 Tax=Candidatus Doudnabacteria bacterium RIFCSPHIGHO2_12_FULL_48_16 TaxID=1817838 RepID=A0A1F5PJU9_9BACT|nr:MAG: hypothetical protein A3B77_04395 [Candidatus Doudnabacteria bacterium RIFCSPHIGHO2_02_FULL_49_24]OGE90171.1 MAG: hypothetical protein A3E29_03655 [Candidatus Doudnabacteria bacterium RIFCSPHIGHO2_12_FULL_48_16]OGE97818.1 MAG: hypothetical protein A2990_04200 [Candidatus Doudnabacteria bacterium RIFCSPLOWO2_01_FULL_49_40]OGF03315.1 MAG: hypothetical protein A3J07_04520 [Candidatus Doudnabacteria bacterium RIFCSPLOWO2_02_FULL_49_13]OGF03475.1 MAG: hypothetical protein A3H14_04355 [Candida
MDSVIELYGMIGGLVSLVVSRAVAILHYLAIEQPLIGLGVWGAIAFHHYVVRMGEHEIASRYWSRPARLVELLLAPVLIPMIVWGIMQRPRWMYRSAVRYYLNQLRAGLGLTVKSRSWR